MGNSNSTNHDMLNNVPGQQDETLAIPEPVSRSPAETSAKKKNFSTDEYKLFVETHAQYDSETFDCQIPDFLAMTTVGCPAYDQEDTAGIDVVCVLDKSGSMHGSKISLVRKAMRRLVRNLRDKDRVAFVAFDTRVSLLLPFTKMDQEGKSTAKDAIGRLKVGSSTNLCGGLLEGIELLKNDNSGNEVQAILLFTDGQANVGVSTEPGILQEVKQAAGFGLTEDASQWTIDDVCSWLCKVNLQMYCDTFRNNSVDGEMLINDLTSELLSNDLNVKRVHLGKFSRAIDSLRGEQPEQIEGEGETTTTKGPEPPQNQRFQLHTFGFGLNHNTSLLETLSNEFDGMYYFMEDEDSIIEGFAACLGGLLAVAAKDIEMVFRPANGVLDFKVKKQDGVTVNPDGSVTYRFPDLHAEETKHIVVSGMLPPIFEADPNYEMFTGSIKYKNCIKDCDEQEEFVGTVNRSGEQGEKILEVDVANNQAVSAEAMAQAARLAEQRRFEDARTLITETQTFVATSKSGQSQDAWCRNVTMDFEDCLAGLTDANAYATRGCRYLTQNRVCMDQERSSHFRADTFHSQRVNVTPNQTLIRNEFRARDAMDSPSPETYRPFSYSAPVRQRSRSPSPEPRSRPIMSGIFSNVPEPTIMDGPTILFSPRVATQSTQADPTILFSPRVATQNTQTDI